MTWAIRSCALAAGAAALLSTQAVYAAPFASASTSVDPLVSLSVLGTPQSRAAVCGNATTPGAMSSAVFRDSSGGCTVSLAMASAPMGIAAAGAAATAQDDSSSGHIGVLPILLGLGLLAAAIVAITSGGGSGKGDLSPVSPQ